MLFSATFILSNQIQIGILSKAREEAPPPAGFAQSASAVGAAEEAPSAASAEPPAPTVDAAEVISPTLSSV